jgi:hypothetical protein
LFIAPLIVGVIFFAKFREFFFSPFFRHLILPPPFWFGFFPIITIMSSEDSVPSRDSVPSAEAVVRAVLAPPRARAEVQGCQVNIVVPPVAQVVVMDPEPSSPSASSSSSDGYGAQDETLALAQAVGPLGRPPDAQAGSPSSGRRPSALLNIFAEEGEDNLVAGPDLSDAILDHFLAHPEPARDLLAEEEEQLNVTLPEEEEDTGEPVAKKPRGDI